MNSRPIRVLALLLLVSVVAAQAHFCIESNAARSTRHQCQLCKSGGWAMPAPDATLDAQLVCNPLLDELTPSLAHYRPVEATSSRAPPLS
jgi:hypothetical protein